MSTLGLRLTREGFSLMQYLASGDLEHFSQKHYPMRLILFFVWPSDFQEPNGQKTCETLNSNALENILILFSRAPSFPRQTDSSYHAPKQPDSLGPINPLLYKASVKKEEKNAIKEIFTSCYL